MSNKLKLIIAKTALLNQDGKNEVLPKEDTQLEGDNCCINDVVAESLEDTLEPFQGTFKPQEIEPFKGAFGPEEMRCLALIAHNKMKPTMKA